MLKGYIKHNLNINNTTIIITINTILIVTKIVILKATSLVMTLMAV